MSNKYLEKIAGISPITRSILRTAAAGSAVGGVVGAASADKGSRTKGALGGAAIGGVAGAGIAKGIALGRASKIRNGMGNLVPGSSSSLVPSSTKLKNVKDVNPKMVA